MNIFSKLVLFIDKFVSDLLSFNLYACSFFISSVIFLLICITYLYLRFRNLNDNKIVALSHSINSGVWEFLKKISLLIIPISSIVMFLLYEIFGLSMSISFVVGIFVSYTSILISLKSAHKGAGRTVLFAKTGEIKSFSITFISGIISGFAFASLSLMGISFLMYNINNNLDILNNIIGFAFGSAFITFIIRTIGSIYAKSADISSYLLKKMYQDKNLNISYIADNIGDNINNIAGLGMDIMDSSITAIVSGIILASIIPVVNISRYIGISITRGELILLPVIISIIGLLSSFLGVVFWPLIKKDKPENILGSINTIIVCLFSIISFSLLYFFSYPLNLFIPIFCGALLSVIISKFVEIYTKGSFINYILKYSVRGAAGNIMAGLYQACLLVVLLLFVLVMAIYVSYTFSGIYGLSLASIGLISNFAFILTIGSSGPICDNAHSISVMSAQSPKINKVTANLDMMGNTSAVITKILNISVSILTMLSLFIVYKQEVEFYYKSRLLMDITNINILIGLLIGISIIVFAIFYITGSIDKMINSMLDYYIKYKCKKVQISNNNGLIIHLFKRISKKFLDKYNKLNSVCISNYHFDVDSVKYFINLFISKSIKCLFVPILFIICVPIITFLMGAELIIGMMLGSFLFGLGLSLLMYNSGVLWDNAKKENYIQKLIKKNTKSDQDAILAGDIVGDYFKDALGPFINITVKLIFIIALLIVPLTKHILL